MERATADYVAPLRSLGDWTTLGAGFAEIVDTRDDTLNFALCVWPVGLAQMGVAPCGGTWTTGWSTLSVDRVQRTSQWTGGSKYLRVIDAITSWSTTKLAGAGPHECPLSSIPNTIAPPP
jgi:hypothetical protein